MTQSFFTFQRSVCVMNEFIRSFQRSHFHKWEEVKKSLFQLTEYKVYI